MKKGLACCAMLAFCLGLALPGHADTFFADNYWGGTVINASPTAYGDVISGPLGEFALGGFSTSQAGNQLTVKVLGPYFNAFANNIGLAGQYGPRDLYLASQGWTDPGVAPYPTDTFNAAGGWDYVVTQSGRLSV